MAHGTGPIMVRSDVIRYILPVLWMPSCFHIMGSIQRIDSDKTVLNDKDQQVLVIDCALYEV